MKKAVILFMLAVVPLGVSCSQKAEPQASVTVLPVAPVAQPVSAPASVVTPPVVKPKKVNKVNKNKPEETEDVVVLPLRPNKI